MTGWIMDLCQWIEGLVRDKAAQDTERSSRCWVHVEERLAEMRRDTQAKHHSGLPQPSLTPSARV